MTRVTRQLFTASPALACLVALGCSGDPPPPPEARPGAHDVVTLTEAQQRVAGIVTSRLETGRIRLTVPVPGSVASPDTAAASIGSVVEGRVANVHVLPGDDVRAGAPLVEIHSHELAQAQRDFVTAEAAETFHRNALQRSEALLQAGAVSLEEVQRRTADLRAAEADLSRAVEMLEHLNPSEAGNVVAAAPREGTIFTVHVRTGQAVVPGTPLVDMGSTEVLWVTAFVPEHVATSIAAGDTADVRFRAPEAVVPARVVGLGSHVDPMNRSVEMRFELLEIPPGVRPGTFATVDVPSSEAVEGADVSDQTAVSLGGRDVVFVSEGNGVYRAVDVDAVPAGEGRIVITGLPSDTAIVVEGAYFLKAALEQAVEAGDTP